MALDNVISVEFTTEEIQKINEAIATIETILRGKTINLTPEERQQYGRIADRNKLLVDKCKTYMEQYATSLPPTLDKAEFDRDYKARTEIEPVIKRLSVVQTMFSDMKTLLDFDNFNAAVSYYRFVKFLASQNAAGMSAVYADLRTHYQHRSSSVEPTEKEPTE